MLFGISKSLGNGWRVGVGMSTRRKAQPKEKDVFIDTQIRLFNKQVKRIKSLDDETLSQQALQTSELFKQLAQGAVLTSSRRDQIIACNNALRQHIKTMPFNPIQFVVAWVKTILFWAFISFLGITFFSIIVQLLLK